MYFSKNLIVIALVFLTLTSIKCNKDCIKTNKCNLEHDAGRCRAYIPKYYFNKNSKKCEEFIWGGCGGVIPFDTMEECEKNCNCK